MLSVEEILTEAEEWAQQQNAIADAINAEMSAGALLAHLKEIVEDRIPSRTPSSFAARVGAG